MDTNLNEKKIIYKNQKFIYIYLYLVKKDTHFEYVSKK